MTEQELREKIVKKLNIIQDYGYVCRIDGTSGTCHNVSNESVADALIAAGIGDVSEWKHRAKIAERAVREFAVQVGCKSCPFYCRCGIDSPNAKNDYQECYEAMLRQAERELQEERKE